MTKIFDTLKYTKGAEQVGIKREHAEYQAQQIAEIIDYQVVTKSDFWRMENALLTSFHNLELKFDAAINGLELKISDESKYLALRLTIKLGTIMIAGIGVLGFLLKY